MEMTFSMKVGKIEDGTPILILKENYKDKVASEVLKNIVGEEVECNVTWFGGNSAMRQRLEGLKKENETKQKALEILTKP